MSVGEVPFHQPPVTRADPAKGKAVVLFDGMCPLCQRAVRALKPLDWFQRLHFQDCRDTAHWPPSAVPLTLKALLSEMHLITPDRKRAPTGFRAFRWMAWRLPLLLPLAPFLYLPGVPGVGNRVYLWIARNRYNLVPCNDGECRVPLGARNTGGTQQRTEESV